MFTYRKPNARLRCVKVSKANIKIWPDFSETSATIFFQLWPSQPKGVLVLFQVSIFCGLFSSSTELLFRSLRTLASSNDQWLQCDEIGQFFSKYFMTNITTEVTQMNGDFLGYFDKHHMLRKTALDTFWATLGKIRVTLISTTGHTECFWDGLLDCSAAIQQSPYQKGLQSAFWLWAVCPFFKNGPTPASFHLFLVFSNKQYNFNNKSMWKNSCPSSIRHWDSNSQPSDCESQPIITIDQGSPT